MRAHDVTHYYADDPANNGTRGTSLTRGENWRDNASFRKFVLKSHLPAMAARIMRSNEVRLFEDLLIYRGPDADRPTPWHQDSGQNPLSGRNQCSIWFSLEPLKPENGALRFAAGTHRGPTYIPYVPDEQKPNVMADMRFFDGGPLPNPDAEAGAFPIKQCDVTPGDILIFHPNALHSAGGAPAGHARRTFSIRFAGDDVRFEPKATTYHQWLRDLDLKKGDKLEAECFPVLWPA